MEANYFVYETSIGDITIVSDGMCITHVKRKNYFRPFGTKKANKLIESAFEQIGEYLKGRRQSFNMPLNLCGTRFQQSVWAALMDIPYGETRSYKQIAEAIGNPNACRAVGAANGKNPVWFIVPCHRVIGADGSLVGYGGGLELKEKLLKIEGI